MDNFGLLQSAAQSLKIMAERQPELSNQKEFIRLAGYLEDQLDVSKMNMDGAALIQDERSRQIHVERFSDEHDDRWVNQELLDAAYCYYVIVRAETDQHRQKIQENFMNIYPQTWALEWWKPSDSKIRNLVKSGALIAAEIDRLKRKGVN